MSKRNQYHNPIQEHSYPENKNKEAEGHLLNKYKSAVRARKVRVILCIVALFCVEAGTLVSFGSYMLSANFFTRMKKEVENQVSGNIETPTGLYEGDTDLGIFQGDGVFRFNTGSIYSGEWEDNQMEGLGKLEIPSEGIYEGEFDEGQKEGNGTFIWEDGAEYSGEWDDDQMTGKGIYSSEDGIIYDGLFENNEFIEGSVTCENKMGEYKVHFEDGAIETAEITFVDGTTYSGDYEETGINGEGTMIYVSEDTYTGEYEEGVRDGKGKYTWNTNDVYEGSWDSDNMDGNGIYTFNNGSYANGIFDENIFIEGEYYLDNDFGTYSFAIEEGEATSVDMTLENGTRYSGGMSKGKLDGDAQIKYSNGDSYSGEIHAGKKSGQGTYNWKSGASYSGEWSKDKMNGTGIYLYPKDAEGYKLEGHFKNGVPSGKCTYYVSSTEYYKTDWSNGKCVKIYE